MIPNWAQLPSFEGAARKRILRTRIPILAVSALFAIRFSVFLFGLPRSAAPTRTQVTTLKLRRRYATGAAAGFVASLHADSGRDLRRALLFAELFAHWSCFLITADAVMDQDRLPYPESRRLLSRLFGTLYPPDNRQLVSDPTQVMAAYAKAFGESLDNDCLHAPVTLHLPLEGLGHAAAAEVAAALRALHAWHFKAGLAAPFSSALTSFYTRSAMLARGQLLSLEQSLVDAEHDWPWYVRLFDSKTSNILFCLFDLYVDEFYGTTVGKRLTEAFVALNQLFLHRQALDDLLDFHEDLGHGVANSLIGILVSQGRIAEAVLAHGGSNPAHIVAEVEHAALVWKPLPLGATAEVMAHAALVNRSGDADRSFEALAHTRASAYRAALAAWKLADRPAIAQLVKDSGIAERILGWIESGVAKVKVDAAISQLIGHPLQDVLFFFHQRTCAVFQRCAAAWRGAKCQDQRM